MKNNLLLIIALALVLNSASASAGTTVYGSFLTAAGGDAASVSGTRTISGETWNDIQLPAGTDLTTIDASDLADSFGGSSGVTFAANFNMLAAQFQVAGQDSTDDDPTNGVIGVSTAPEWDWYNLPTDGTVKQGNRVSSGWATTNVRGTEYTTYTLAGFDPSQTVTLDFVISKSGGALHQVGVEVVGGTTSFLSDNFAGNGGNDHQFSVELTGESSYDIILNSRHNNSTNGNEGPIGNAFRITLDGGGTPPIGNFAITQVEFDGLSTTLIWNSAASAPLTYSVDFSTDLTGIEGWIELIDGISPGDGETSYEDVFADRGIPIVAPPAGFYRVRAVPD
jgi:hypothetical protein